MKSLRHKKMAGFFCNSYFFFVFLKLQLSDFLVCSFGLQAFWACFGHRAGQPAGLRPLLRPALRPKKAQKAFRPKLQTKKSSSYSLKKTKKKIFIAKKACHLFTPTTFHIPAPNSMINTIGPGSKCCQFNFERRM